MGVNKAIALNKEPSFGYSYVKVHNCNSISIKFFTTCEWQVSFLAILYEMHWLLHNSMLAKVSKMYEIDATCYFLNTKIILLTKKSGHELNIGQNQGLEVIWNSEILEPKYHLMNEFLFGRKEM